MNFDKVRVFLPSPFFRNACRIRAIVRSERLIPSFRSSPCIWPYPIFMKSYMTLFFHNIQSSFNRILIAQLSKIIYFHINYRRCNFAILRDFYFRRYHQIWRYLPEFCQYVCLTTDIRMSTTDKQASGQR